MNEETKSVLLTEILKIQITRQEKLIQEISVFMFDTFDLIKFYITYKHCVCLLHLISRSSFITFDSQQILKYILLSTLLLICSHRQSLQQSSQHQFCRQKNRCLIEHASQHYEKLYIQYIMRIFLGDLIDSENYYHESQNSLYS